MSVILGLNHTHADASACLLVDGELKAAVAEERLGERVKHDPRYPWNAIASVLKEAGVSASDITHVATPRKPNANLAAKLSYVAQSPLSGGRAAVEHFRRRNGTLSSVERFADGLGLDADRLGFEEVAVEHHVAHIASAYYCSPFDSLTAGFSYDASGDFVSAMVAKCEGNKLQVWDRVTLPHSLGFFYTAICQFIGFDGFGEEYKVMGLAPYGRDRYQPLMERLVRLDADGWFKLDTKFFGMHQGGTSGELDHKGHIEMGRFYTDALIRELGEPRKRGGPLTQREKDLARSCQVRFQRVALDCMNRLHEHVPSTRVAYAGGCALNGVANALFLRESPFDEAYLQCAASDDGTSLGAALWAYHNVVGGTQRFEMKHAYWGPSHLDTECESAVGGLEMPIKVVDDELERARLGARLVHAGLVVGWYQGRAEWGPRALGNRSILADPLNANMKDIINRKIKRRESFRPFAPSVLSECMTEYFEQSVDSPFMMHVVRVKTEWRERLPAITHVDGTARLQTVRRETNPLYYQLIDEFRKLSGVGIVLNTSFNENEPIVETPEQALACFTRTDMDAIVLGSRVVVKPEHAGML